MKSICYYSLFFYRPSPFSFFCGTLLVPTSAFRLVAHLGRERFLVCAYMDGGTWYVSFHKNLVWVCNIVIVWLVTGLGRSLSIIEGLFKWTASASESEIFLCKSITILLCLLIRNTCPFNTYYFAKYYYNTFFIIQLLKNFTLN